MRWHRWLWYALCIGLGHSDDAVASRFQRALQLHQTGEVDAALAEYRMVIAHGEEKLTTKALTMAYTNAGALELSVAGDEVKAGELLAQASRTSPSSASAHGNECVFWASRDSTRARQACARALQLDPGNLRASSTLEELALDAGEDMPLLSSPTPPLPQTRRASLLSIDAIERRWPGLDRLVPTGPPFVWRLRAALSTEACKALVAHGDRVGWTPSKTTGDASWRVSLTATLPWESAVASPLLRTLGRDLLRYAETPQIVSYPANGFFRPHSDAVSSGYYGRRELTWLFYLDDSDCATHFPFAYRAPDPNFPRFDLAHATQHIQDNQTGLFVYPAAGDALLFVNVHMAPPYLPDALAIHVSRTFASPC